MSPSEVIRDGAGNARIPKPAGEVVSARFGPPLKLPEHDLAVIDVLDDSRFKPIQAHEAKTAQDLVYRRHRGQLLLISKAILQRQQRGFTPNQRRQERAKLIISGRLQADDYKATSADFCRVPRTLWLNAEVALGAPDQNTFAPNGVVIRTQQKMNLLPGAGKLRAVETANCPATNHRDFHGTQQKRHSECFRVPL